MKGIFVNRTSGIDYAAAIIGGYKAAETRSRDMLKSLTGERVAIIRTGRGEPVVIGYATIDRKEFVPKDSFGTYFDFHLVPPGSKYDAKAKGKWLYWMKDPEKCEPYTLPQNTVRHGRSWCEF